MKKNYQKPIIKVRAMDNEAILAASVSVGVSDGEINSGRVDSKKNFIWDNSDFGSSTGSSSIWGDEEE